MLITILAQSDAFQLLLFSNQQSRTQSLLIFTIYDKDKQQILHLWSWNQL